MTAKEILYDMNQFLNSIGQAKAFDDIMLEKGFSQEEVDEMNKGLEDIDSLED